MGQHPFRDFLLFRLHPLINLTIIYTVFLYPNDDSPCVVYGWIPRGGHNTMNIYGHPKSINSSSRVFMKKKGKKQGKKNDNDFGDNEKEDNEIKMINGFGSKSFEITDGIVARLEAIYEMNSLHVTGQDWLFDHSKKPWNDDLHINTADFSTDRSELSDGACLSDCCGEECDEQCDIPEEYKLFAMTDGGAPKVDVMSFLGIRRVEPLRVQVQRDWE